MVRYHYFSAFSDFEKYIYREAIYNFLKKLNIEYPEFHKWYNNLFENDKNLKADREIIICEKDYVLAGVVILKSSKEEKKICTLRVAKQYQRQGIGSTLVEKSFEWLQDDKPIITMHKSKQHQFASLLDYYGFSLEQKQWSYYSLFSTELSYNGVLPEKNIFFNRIEIEELTTWYKNFLESGRKNVNQFIDECIQKWYLNEQKKRIHLSKN